MSESIQRIKQAFQELLLKSGAEIEAQISLKKYSGLNDLYSIKGLGHVAIFASAENPASWEIDESLVKDLDSLCQNQSQDQNQDEKIWYIFLIVRQDGRGANGYIVSDFDAQPVKKPFEVLDGRYTIKEKRNFDSLRLLLSTDKIVNILLRNKK